GKYILAVSSAEFVPAALQSQFDTRLPPNPFARNEPVDSLVRIVHTNFDFIPDPEPIVPNFIGLDNVVPFHLGDVGLFVSRPGGETGSEIYTVDPFTGARETLVGAIDLVVD